SPLPSPLAADATHFLSSTDASERAKQGRAMLNGFALYKWKPNLSMSADDNFMDLIMLVTRNSICKEGHTACAIVRGTRSKFDSEDQCYAELMSVATNTWVYLKPHSDCHAEIHALGRASKETDSVLKGATAYITIAPCKNCFVALWAAGVQRIVTTQAYRDPVKSAAKEHGIELVTANFKELEQRARRQVQQDPEQVEKDRSKRKARKEMERDARKRQKTKREAHQERLALQKEQKRLRLLAKAAATQQQQGEATK
ncbi:MAG: deaminase, partial [Myxococcota bacterium]